MTLKEYYKEKLNNLLFEAKDDDRDYEDTRLPSQRIFSSPSVRQLKDWNRAQSRETKQKEKIRSQDIELDAKIAAQKEKRYKNTQSPEVSDTEKPSKTQTLLDVVHHFSKVHGLGLNQQHITGLDFTQDRETLIRQLENRLGF